jgi:hypothetical protein
MYRKVIFVTPTSIKKEYVFFHDCEFKSNFKKIPFLPLANMAKAINWKIVEHWLEEV